MLFDSRVICEYLNGQLFRFAALGWKHTYPKTAAWFERFAARESMLTTRPPAG